MADITAIREQAKEQQEFEATQEIFAGRPYAEEDADRGGNQWD